MIANLCQAISMKTTALGPLGPLGLAGCALLSVIAVGAARTNPMPVQQMPAQQKTAPQAPPRAAADNAALIARGEYLANSVAMCVQCHSPRDDRGNILEAQKFHGGAMPVTGPVQMREWAFKTPNIAGLLGFTDEQFLELIMDGKASGRDAPRPPMPPFRMARPEAEALLAYLRSR
jgi:mono/diheme cytochrome c family protein